MSDRWSEISGEGSDRDRELRRVEKILDAFEREWIEGREPRIADFVASVPEAERADIRRELELIEQDYRNRRGASSEQTNRLATDDTSREQGERAGWSGGSSRYRIAHVLADGDDDEVGDGAPDVTSDEPDRAAGEIAPENASWPVPAHAIGGYAIIKELHRGGQGIVYQAVQESTKQKVALKVLLHGEFAGTTQRRRFEREIELIGSLQHPNIAKIFDSGVSNGQLFFVMQYIRGRKLTDHARDNRLSINDSLCLFTKVCHAVDHAHQRGVIHRDLKPSNIIVDERDKQPYVLDFGLAKIGGPNAANLHNVSLTGEVLGTPAYMSPEQAGGRPDDVDMRSDVYSLGVIAYEMLTGALPHADKGQIGDLLHAIQHAEPKRLRTINREIQDEVDTILMKALSKDRARRYPTAGSLGDDIQRFLEGEAIEAKRDSVLYMAKRILRRYRFAAAITVAFVIVVCVSLLMSLSLWRSAAHDRDLARNARTRESDARRDADQARGKAERIAKEQERRAYNGYIARAAAALEEDNAAIMKRMLDSCANPELRGWEWYYLRSLVDRSELWLDAHQVNAMAQSVDGRWIASGGADGLVRIWDTDSMQLARTPLETPGRNIVYALAFSPDGRRIVAGDLGSSEIGKFPRTTLKVWDIMSGDLRQVGDESSVLCVAWSPDGRWIGSGGTDGVAKLWDTHNGFAAHVVDQIEHTDVLSICFSPDGASLLVAFDDRLGLWDVATGRRHWMELAGTQAVGHAAFSPNGESIVWGTKEFHQQGAMELWDAKTGERRTRFFGHRGAATSVAFGPGGSRIISGGSDHTLRLWDPVNGELLDTFRGHMTKVNGGMFAHPAGNRIYSAGNDGIRVWNSEPPPDFIALDGHQGQVTGIAFSPDGRQLVSAGLDRTVRLWDTDTARQIKQWWDGAYVSHVDFSADGRHVASVSYADKSKNVRGIKRVKLWQVDADWPEASDPRRNEFLESICIPQQPMHIESVAFGASGGTRLVTHQHKTVQLWDVSSRQKIAELFLGEDHAAIADVAFSSDGAYLAISGLFQPGISLVDATTIPPKLLPRLRDLPFYPTCLAFDAAGRRIASGTLDGTVYIVDVETGEHISLIGHSGPAIAVAFDPQGDRLFTGGRDRTVKVWNARTGEDLLTLRGHQLAVTSVAVSADGQTVATASDDKTIRLWRGPVFVDRDAGSAGPATGNRVRRAADLVSVEKGRRPPTSLINACDDFIHDGPPCEDHLGRGP